MGLQQGHKKAYANGSVSTSTPGTRLGPKERVVRYKECMRNHAANIGGYAVDGCTEFMASGAEGTAAAYVCAACNCHRSFHKREVESDNESDSCDCSSVTTASR